MKKRVLFPLITLLIGLSGGVFLQYHKIPSSIKWSVIRAGQEIMGKKSFDYSAPVDQYKLKAFGEPVVFFNPEKENYIGTTKPEKTYMTKDEFVSYRYFWHFKEISDYLTSKEAKQIAATLHDAFWIVKDSSIADYLAAMEPKRKFIKEALGIKNLPINGRVRESAVISDNKNVVIEKRILESRIPAISVPLYIARPKGVKVKGVVIAIHGCESVPEKVVGLEPRDYTRQFGLELAKRGYVVYAPYIINIKHKPANISGLGQLYTGNTNWSIDLQKLLSVVDNIKSDKNLSTLPIVTYGISIGGHFALMLPAFDERVNVAISSGALGVTATEEDFAIEGDVDILSYALADNVYKSVYFRYSDYARLVYPRPIIVEMGALDLPIGDDKLWLEMKGLYAKYNMSNNLKLIWFKGFHETVPELTIPALDEIIEDLNSKKYSLEKGSSGTYSSRK